MAYLNYMYNNKTYSDITVVFNDKEFYLQLEYIKQYSNYFDCVAKKQFKEQSSVSIAWTDIDGKLIDPSYFDNIMKILYDYKDDIRKHTMSSHMNDDLVKLLDYHNLMDYLKIDTRVCHCVKYLIKHQINSVSRTEFKSHTYTIWNSHMYKNTTPQSVFVRGTIGSELIKLYNKNNSITINHINYMLNLFDDKNLAFKRKIIGIGNYNLDDVNILEEKYRMLALGSLVFDMDFLNTQIK